MAKDRVLQPFLSISKDKFTVDTIEDLKLRKDFNIGDVVELNGYNAAGDGLGHKRKISNANDGTGVQLNNGLWGNVVPNSDGSKKQDKIDNRLTTVSKDVVEAINSCYSPVNKPNPIDIGAFTSNGGQLNNKNLNEVTKSGTYQVGLNCTNFPNGANQYGTLFVSKPVDVDTMFQMYVMYEDSTIWIRTANQVQETVVGSGVWKPWKKIMSESDFSSSLTEKGWQRLSSGLIFQWGRESVTNVNTGHTYNFPISFTTNYNLFCSPKLPNRRFDVAQANNGVQNISLSQFKIISGQGESPCVFDWIAIGY